MMLPVAGTEYQYLNHLLDRLNNESAVSGALYVALISLWTVVVDKKMPMDETIIIAINEAIHQYEKMHIP